MENYESNSGIMWDFRQFYVEWVKVYVGDFISAQRVKDYPEMLEKIQDWHAIIWGRVINNLEKQKEDEKFNEIMSEIIKTANEYRDTYTGRKKNSAGASKLNRLFQEAVSYIVFLMKKNKLFGDSNINTRL
jgi:hypothetical protein